VGHLSGRALLRSGGSASIALAPAPRVDPASLDTAVIRIRGVMTQREEWFDCGEAANYEEIGDRFCDACGDPGVGSILLDGDTPGGDVPGIEQTIARMILARDACGKPVVGFCNELLASGGVWLFTTVCHAIFLPGSGRMGSVGVVIEHETNAREAAGKGIDRTVIRFPPGKYDPNPDEVLSDLGRARLTELVTATGERFVAAVAAARGIDPAAILAWNGGVFTGQAAVDAKLADGLGSLESAIAYAGTLAALGAAA
jgi:ClpP class serine protease